MAEPQVYNTRVSPIRAPRCLGYTAGQYATSRASHQLKLEPVIVATARNQPVARSRSEQRFPDLRSDSSGVSRSSIDHLLLWTKASVPTVVGVIV